MNGTVGGGDANTTQFWDPNKGSAEDLWPSDQQIWAANVLIRKAPDIPPPPSSTNGVSAPAFLAVVVWNHATVGRIYWIPFGSTGTDFHHTWDSTLALRTNNAPNNGGGSDGSPIAGSGSPTPHPNVDQYGNFINWYLRFLDGFVANAKTAAYQVDYGLNTFLSYDASGG
ncbi:MAG: hypothetical protein ACM31C_13875 [Acidobacteriota bacterium]